MGAFYITFVINFLIFVKFIRPCQTGIGFFFFFLFFFYRNQLHMQANQKLISKPLYEREKSKSKYQESKQLSTQKTL